MNLSSSSAYILAAAALLAPLAACSIKASAESAVRYEASDETLSAAYTAGQDISVSGGNGRINVVGGGGSEVSATFSPFILDAKDNEDNARAHMEKNLSLTVEDTGSGIVVKASRASGSSGSLGADITVRLPDDFDGTFSLNQGNGGTDIDLRSVAPTSLDVFSDNGSVDMHLGVFAPGTITLDGAGSLFLGIPTNSNGQLTASTDGVGDLIDNSSSEWEASPDNGEQAGSWTMGDGSGGLLTVVADFDIEISAE